MTDYDFSNPEPGSWVTVQGVEKCGEKAAALAGPAAPQFLIGDTVIATGGDVPLKIIYVKGPDQFGIQDLILYRPKDTTMNDDDCVESDMIYLVCASLGEYSDRKEWVVAAYADEPLAQEHVALAQAAANRFESLSKSERDERLFEYSDDDPEKYAGFKTYDAAFEARSGDAPRYFLTKALLRTALPTED